MRYWVLVLFLVGCSKDAYVESSFLPYVRDFETLSKKKVDISITFQNLMDGSAAHCISNGGLGSFYGSEIVVDRATWERECPSRRRAILYHELGHCVLDRGHTNNPWSYMQPQITNSCEYYEMYRRAFDLELISLIAPDRPTGPIMPPINPKMTRIR